MLADVRQTTIRPVIEATIAKELDLGVSDVQAMTEALRQGLTARAPVVVLDGEGEVDEVYVVAGHKGNPAAVAKRGASGDAAG